MLGTTQESQNELGKFSQEQWDQFVEKLTKKEKDALEAAKKESKKSKK
ncbi:hypothetical protein HGO53_04840 [Wolbachia endosymbiont of Diaphorina citri]|jgi:hypothetical protein|nr:hypothetical protein [Wolbachia endosymbiont of Diaphorina citri]QJT94572.1 hypothetical protein HGO48_04130 [Wolbachia endosymbiont of Diaphorina citri]QJT95811.1 hypothetical protein HGO49_04130 [Wolbachia endosymbiont of Diaphorina citri]QJT97173.1 hypothetical protein HGO53_04840 [Wolbachia endosymbiont of Diaphorina citri]QLK11470.1 hypothetical protein FK497_04190 [Wolbachia endosymbiont of Diaphorina citri]QXY86995.1 hypothetical protein GZ064_03430 [Wolbachia endosymbiont of Diaphor